MTGYRSCISCARARTLSCVIAMQKAVMTVLVRCEPVFSAPSKRCLFWNRKEPFLLTFRQGQFCMHIHIFASAGVIYCIAGVRTPACAVAVTGCLQSILCCDVQSPELLRAIPAILWESLHSPPSPAPRRIAPVWRPSRISSFAHMVRVCNALHHATGVQRLSSLPLLLSPGLLQGGSGSLRPCTTTQQMAFQRKGSGTISARHL